LACGEIISSTVGFFQAIAGSIAKGIIHVGRVSFQAIKKFYGLKKNFTRPHPQYARTDFSRFEALVRKRESLLKFI